MKIIYYIVLLFLLINSINCNSQNWNTKIGVNTISILAGSYEVTTETTNKSIYSIIANVGYAQGRGIRITCAKDDNIEDKKNSGKFFKIGGKVYILNLFDKQKDDIFIGISIIGSEYKSSGIEKDGNLIESNGFIWGLACITGYKVRLKKRLELDIGGQLSISQRRNDFIGTYCHNYQPGMGWEGLNPNTTRLQIILNLKYRIGKKINFITKE